MIVSGGGVIYSEAEEVLKLFAEQTGIPVAETFAGKGSKKRRAKRKNKNNQDYGFEFDEPYLLLILTLVVDHQEKLQQLKL